MKTKIKFGKIRMLTLLCICLAVLVMPLFVHAQAAALNPSLGSFLSALIATMFGVLAGIIRAFLYGIYAFVILPLINSAAMIKVGSGSCAAGAAPGFLGIVCPGWTLIRNLVNMLFILVLIIIGIATILRIQAYNYKSLLVKLIFMALLVNFSLVIAQAILTVADVTQSTFVTNNGTDLLRLGTSLIYRNDFLGGSGWDGIWQTAWGVNNQSGLSLLAAQFMDLCMSFLNFMIMGAVAVFLVIRLVALWILLILSPFAYALFILPQTKGLASTWWRTFLKYAFFTPIMFFFLRMAVYLDDNRLALLRPFNLCQGAACNADQTFIFNVTQHLVVLAFVLASLLVTRKLAIFGAGALVGMATTAAMLPVVTSKKLGGAAVGAVGRGYTRFTSRKMEAAEKAGLAGRARFYRGLQMLNPRTLKEGWAARAKKKEEEAYGPAAADVRDSLNRVMPTEWKWKKGRPEGMGQKTYFGRAARQQLVEHKKAEYEKANLSEEEKVKAYAGARNGEDLEALSQMIQSGRHEDGRAIIAALERRARKEEEMFKKFIAMGENADAARIKAKEQATSDEPATYDSVEDLDVQTARLKTAGYTDEQVGLALSAQDELAEEERKIRGLGNAVHEWDGTFRAANNFVGYKKLEQEKGSSEMMTALAATGVFKKVMKDVFDSSGAKVGETVEKLEFQGQEIKSYGDLEKVIKATERGDKDKEENLKYELTGARKQFSAQKRIDRGDTELWGQGLEPAAFLEQDEKGRFGRFTSYGRRMFANYSPAAVNAFRKTRRLQARGLKMAGIYKDEKTGQINTSAAVTDYKVMAEAFQLNHDLTNAVVQKAELDATQLAQVKTELDAQYTAMGSALRARVAGESIEVS